jgi:hypothetical protein
MMILKKRVIILLIFSCIVLTGHNVVSQTTITYSESFISGQTYDSSSEQWINWSDFIGQLSPRTYASVTIKGSNEAVGVSVTDATVATAIANALFTNTPGTWTSGGHVWNVGSCGSGIEISAGTTSTCSCQSGYTVRPQIGNSNWGGINGPGCNGGTQTLTVVFVSGNSVVHSFDYTGSPQSFTVPSGVTSITIEAWGAQGGSTASPGGMGGYAKGDLAVTPGEVINLYVGGQGTVYTIGDHGSWTGGGWNGGGLGYRYGRGGGGASDVRKTGTTLANRVIVAAGGGGASNAIQSDGGVGGGVAGASGLRFNVSDPGFCGQGGTYGAGGAASINYGSAAAGGLGQGGNGGSSGNNDGTGGGGGYYGGGGGDQGGAGGGSSYIGGVTAASTTSGQRSGNGLINITYQSYTNDQTYTYSGSSQPWVVPEGVTRVTIEAWGAQGWSGSNSGGLGGYAKGDLNVTPGQTLNIYAGGQGTAALGNGVPSGGGWNGGGNGQTNTSSNSAGGGGGASDVRSGGTTLEYRVIVAAGGGGSTNNPESNGGNGGGLVGSDGGGSFAPGTGGTQLAGGNNNGALGQGGNATSAMTPWNGGGGGGYYGGGVSETGGPGGGGSSYIGGLTNTENNAGVRSGNGLVVITYTLTTTTTPNSPTINYGTSNVDLTASVIPNPGGGTVEFYIDGNSVGSANINPGSGFATFSYNTSLLEVGSYVIRADFGGYNNSPASSSHPLSNGTLTITNPEFDWEGNISTNWSTPENWSTNLVPMIGDNVNIPSGVSRWPHITTDPGSPSVCNTLLIASGAMLTIDPGKALSVSGAISNNAGNTGLVIEPGGSLLTSTNGLSATVKSDITGGEWHFISIPVTNAVAGIFTGKYLQKHTESTNLYTDITSVSEVLSPMKGYALWGDETGFVATYSGTLNQGSKSYNTTYSGTGKGWNLVGNPYPSSIDWNAGSGWTKTAVNNATYVHLNSATWASYIGGVGTNGGSQYIAPGQGFFVNAYATGSLQMNDDVRVHHTTTFFKQRDVSINNLVRLEVSGNNFRDETVLRFLPESTLEFDGQYDALKLFGDVAEAAQIYSSANFPLAINTLPESNSVPVGIHVGLEGNYSISVTEVSDFTELSLEDTKTGIYTDMLKKSYSFNASPGEDELRFVLHFNTLSIDETNSSQGNIYSYANTVFIDLKPNVRGNVYVYNISGQLVANLQSIQGSKRINIPDTGNYIVKIITDKETLTKKVWVK